MSGHHRTVLAADIGGTNIRAALVDQHGTISWERRCEARLSTPGLSSNQIVDMIAGVLTPMLGEQTSAIGLGFPGFFRGSSGVLAASPNLPEIKELALTDELGGRLNLPVAAQNDALCASIGEQQYGAGIGCDNLLHITLGTGVGGGLILNGQPWTGEQGMAMEFGHLRVADDGQCGCGLSGCLETKSSATAVCRGYANQTGEQLDAAEIYKRACAGDARAVTCFEQAGHYLGGSIAETIKLMDIHTVTISGGLIGAWPMLHPALMHTLNDRLIAPQRDSVRVLASTLSDQAGLLGAAVIAWQLVMKS